jgi:hypothetical protein
MINKLKPLDKKLEYQVTKMLRLANGKFLFVGIILKYSIEETLLGQSYSKKADTEDPLALKPKPETMSKTMTTDEIDVGEDGTILDSKSKKYVVPKFSATVMEVNGKKSMEIDYLKGRSKDK